MNHKLGICLIALPFLLFSCNKPTIWEGSMNGKAQKGPFINGSSITVFELSEDLGQTGRNFNTQISNNSGAFSLNGVSLGSNRVLLRVDGFYFNEICGSISGTQITLNGIVDASSTSSFNLNVMTHLEKDRVQTLVSEGTSFEDAKIQAQSELLAAFGISTSGISNSEMLDMSGSSDGDAIMIALSCIMQGHRSENQLSSVMASFSSDFGSDGTLDDSTLISDLVLHAQSLNLATIRTNIESRYSQLGIPVSIPDFEAHIADFLAANSPVIGRSVIDFPAQGGNGANVLDLDRTVYPAGGPHSLAANMPDDCMSVIVKITRLSGPTCHACWLLATSSNQNWIKGSYDNDNETQFFTSNGSECDLSMTFTEGSVQFDYYEAGASQPTNTKIVEFQ